MDRFLQQRQVPGWTQERFAEAGVAVYGRDWLGALTVAGLAALGVGRIVWVGEPCAAAATFAEWLQSDPGPFSGTVLAERTVSAEYGSRELDWCLASQPVSLLVSCTEDLAARAACMDYARSRRAPWLAGTTAEGGYFCKGSLPPRNADRQDPVCSLGVAALLVDGVRMTLCPLKDDLTPPEGPLPLATPRGQVRDGTVVCVGVGGIGTWAALVLAALGFRLLLIDPDVVTPGNLNRQVLFRGRDAEAGALKALAARETLVRLFPSVLLEAEAQSVRPDSLAGLAALKPPALALLSAVDHAAARLDIQGLGAKLAVPVVQGGTGLFSADCFVQVPSAGALLDQQMHGALSANAGREAERGARGPCGSEPSYVAPGMMAAALMSCRLLQLCQCPEPLSPLRWRSGSLPS